MKKWGVFVGALILFFVGATKAQQNMDALFSGDNKNILYTNQAKDYTGSPLVFIEGISDKPQPKDWKDKLKIQLFGSMNLPEAEVQKPLPPLNDQPVIEQEGVQIKSLYGEQKTVQFTPHTNEWNFIIQILNDKEILVTEDLVFITTDEVKELQRDWPIDQNLFVPLKAQLNGKEIPFEIEQKSNYSYFQLPQLPSSAHRLHLSYLIKNKTPFQKKEGYLTIPLTGLNWDLPVNSLAGVILMPTKVQVQEPQLLLGKNKQKIEEAFLIQPDINGDLFFKSKHILPASTQILANFNFSFDSFPKADFWDHFWDNSNIILFVVLLGIILGYLILNIIEFQMISDEELIHQKKIPMSSSALHNFVSRIAEILIGICLLFLGTFFILLFIQSSFSLKQWIFLIAFALVGVVLIDFWVFKPRYNKILKWHQKLQGGNQ